MYLYFFSFFESLVIVTIWHMSWKGFTKAISRLPHMVVRATGNAEETKDDQFDELETHFKLLETLINK